MRAIAVGCDLFFQSKIRQTADGLGLTVVFTASERALRDALEAGDVGLVIVDLGALSIDPLEAIAAAAAAATRCVAFVSHVDEETRRRAEEAGCREVLPKSAFTRDLPEILRKSLTA